MNNLLVFLVLMLLLVIFLAAINFAAWRSMQKKEQAIRAPLGQQGQTLSLPTH